MRDTWVYSTAYKNEIISFQTVEIDGIIEIDNSYNIVFRTGEMFVDKDKCIFSEDKIEYTSGDFYICIERDTPRGIMPMAS